jgi:transketolase
MKSPRTPAGKGVLHGGYIAHRETGVLKTILIGCGSELQHALAAAKVLGEGVRVVSMPCTELFNAQSPEYREAVLPAAVRRRVAIEAGVKDAWYQYVGLGRDCVGFGTFWLQRPGQRGHGKAWA